jgi:hypothetical protein
VILRFVLCFALHLGYDLYQLDIDTVYLYGNLKETMYMNQPEDYVKNKAVLGKNHACWFKI